MKSKRRNVTPWLFITVHTLKESGQSVKQIVESIGVSEATVHRIIRMKNFEEYKAFLEVVKQKEQNRKAVKRANKGERITIEPLKIVTAEQMNMDAGIRQAIRQINDIGIAFHKLAEFLYDNFVMNSKPDDTDRDIILKRAE